MDAGGPGGVAAAELLAGDFARAGDLVRGDLTFGDLGGDFAGAGDLFRGDLARGGMA
jgi:hypothetical protein